MRRLMLLFCSGTLLVFFLPILSPEQTAYAQSNYPSYVLGLPPAAQMNPPGVQPNDQWAIARDPKHAYRAKPAEIVAGALQGAFDLLFGNVRGSIIYRGQNGWVQRIPGIAGQCLVTEGPGADPIWANCGSGPPPGGPVLLTGGSNILTVGSNLATE